MTEETLADAVRANADLVAKTLLDFIRKKAGFGDLKRLVKKLLKETENE